ncbi:alcohol dehydrogenase [Microtetraspora sp. NBRC 13810]|uniref:alcohol dehydrogenase catalytic domain-containing protein n=1 Tax=Microtetraspora sp. NBRC 13810 TaxID=3030990 RepID=UPI0024A372BD|nr:alcohol dehydrogenase catalytic domain-containing protein [Microtetraspora sp. NBRC 13810]GLW11501.1 alcohol dehydrogenase [Microtetraspora sp. NBRC 13810]
MSTTMKAVRIPEINGALSVVDLPVPQPGRDQVRVAIEACGVCRTDHNIVRGDFGDGPFPLTPGHEIAGRIAALGEGVEGWAVGDRVAVGWFGGNCGHCQACRDGDAINCTEVQVPGVAYPGGYAETVVVPVSALARIPDGLTATEAAPMGCAGVTVFNALRRTSARPGDLVAILGLGGLGHLGVQFAKKMGFDTVAIARGSEKESLAKQLGADHYIDSTVSDVAEALQALGGAKVVLATVSQPSAMTAAFDGLGTRGELVVVGASPDKIEVSPYQLISGQKKLQGHASGTSREVEETMRFAALSGVRAMTEQVPLEQAPAAFDKMLAGDARFRMVLTTNN